MLVVGVCCCRGSLSASCANSQLGASPLPPFLADPRTPPLTIATLAVLLPDPWEPSSPSLAIPSPYWGAVASFLLVCLRDLA